MFLKIPANIGYTPIQLQKAYIAYLWFKNRSEDGFFSSANRGDDRFADHYWSKKLVYRGWMVAVDGGFMLRTYQFVWRQMKIKKVKQFKNNKVRPHFKYIRLNDKIKGYQRKKFHKELLKTIREVIAERIKNQLAFRLVSEASSSPKSKKLLGKLIRAFRTHEKPKLSSAATAKHFGYKSDSSGWTVRKKTFKVQKREEIEMFLSPSNIPFFRYPTSRVSIKQKRMCKRRKSLFQKKEKPS